MRRVNGYSVLRKPVSVRVTVEAWTLTSTSSSFGAGRSTSVTRRTSGGPYRSWTTALMRSPHRRRLAEDPAEAGAGLVRKAAQVREPGAQLVLGGAGQLREALERALHHVGCVVRLHGQVFLLPPESPLALNDLPKTGLVEPTRQASAGIAQPEAAMP